MYPLCHRQMSHLSLGLRCRVFSPGQKWARKLSSKRKLPKDDFNEIVALCKRRGFIFPGSDIYGGFANSFDYGPLGVQLKKNIQDAWWKCFVVKPSNCHGLESSVIMSPKIWEASGHVENFVDPLVECLKCEKRFRADKLLEEHGYPGETMTLEELSDTLEKVEDKACPCGKMESSSWSKPRKFNLLFQTNIGPVESDNDTGKAYLRPETAQGAYINFRNVFSTMRQQLPFGIGQIGKSFRNEISPGNFIFRTREFDQMELQWFCKNDDAEQWYNHWVSVCQSFLVDALGLKTDSIRLRVHEADELAHYARATTDIEYHFPVFGWGELWGIANRGTHDLSCHSEASNQDLSFDLGNANVKNMPTVIEPAVGLNRLLLAILCDAYQVEQIESANGKVHPRTVLRLKRDIAPITAGVFPLSAKQTDQLEICDQIHDMIIEWGNSSIDTKGNIGKRYRRHDEIGTPYCITADFDSPNDNCVTVRDRDSMKQVRLPISVFETKRKFFHAVDEEFKRR